MIRPPTRDWFAVVAFALLAAWCVTGFCLSVSNAVGRYCSAVHRCPVCGASEAP